MSKIHAVRAGVPCGFSASTKSKLFHVKQGRRLLGTITEVEGMFRSLVLNPRGMVTWHNSKAAALAAFG